MASKFLDEKDKVTLYAAKLNFYSKASRTILFRNWQKLLKYPKNIRKTYVEIKLTIVGHFKHHA